MVRKWIGLGMALVFLSACQNETNSELDVSGGEVDVNQRFAATTWFEAKAKGIDQEFSIRSVGTFVDLDRHYASLLFSLADAYSDTSIHGKRVAAMPLLLELELTMYLSDRANAQDKIVVPNLAYDRTGALSHGAHLKIIGASLTKTQVPIPGALKQLGNVEGLVSALNRAIFKPSSLQANGVNYRNALTSYGVISLPLSKFDKLKNVTKARLAKRGDAKNLRLVGFGGTSATQDETKRNSAAVRYAGDTAIDAAVSGSYVAERLWTVSGSGLCYTANSDGSKGMSYDRGSSVFNEKGELVGIAVGSERASGANKFKDYTCSEDGDDIRTLVYTPDMNDIIGK